MFPVNAAFVMVILAIALARVPQREWFSSSIVVFALGLIAAAIQPSFESFVRGEALGVYEMAGLFWCALLWGYSGTRAWEDMKHPPDARQSAAPSAGIRP